MQLKAVRRDILMISSSGLLQADVSRTLLTEWCGYAGVAYSSGGFWNESPLCSFSSIARTFGHSRLCDELGKV